MCSHPQSTGAPLMADVVYVILVVAFFAVTYVILKGVEKL
jgi:hypothetical protein